MHATGNHLVLANTKSYCNQLRSTAHSLSFLGCQGSCHVDRLCTDMHDLDMMISCNVLVSNLQGTLSRLESSLTLSLCSLQQTQYVRMRIQ